MTHPTNAELEAAVNLTEYDEKLGWKTTEASIQVMREATRELLALRTGRHEKFWLATHKIPTDIEIPGDAGIIAKFWLAMRSAAIEGEKDA